MDEGFGWEDREGKENVGWDETEGKSSGREMLKE